MLLHLVEICRTHLCWWSMVEPCLGILRKETQWWELSVNTGEVSTNLTWGYEVSLSIKIEAYLWEIPCLVLSLSQETQIKLGKSIMLRKHFPKRKLFHSGLISYNLSWPTLYSLGTCEFQLTPEFFLLPTFHLGEHICSHSFTDKSQICDLWCRHLHNMCIEYLLCVSKMLRGKTLSKNTWTWLWFWKQSFRGDIIKFSKNKYVNIVNRVYYEIGWE
jgi:hypothetical protein